MTTITINVQAAITWRAERGASRWVAVADALGIAVEADTLDELHSVTDEAIQLLFADLFDDDELDAFLRQRGWSRGAGPAPRHDGDVEFNVPMELVIASAARRGFEHRAH